MRVVRREFSLDSRADLVRIVPIGDVHIGAYGADEARLRRLVARVQADPNARWVGMGDYIDAINRHDKRFAISALAKWVETKHLADLAKAQVQRFLSIVAPIASQCLALLEGNHEEKVLQHNERDVYGEIVAGIKDAAGWGDEHKLAVGYTGYLQLVFRRSGEDKRQGGTAIINVGLHHGFGGGKRSGSKANNLEDWMRSYEMDLGLMGHTHSGLIVPTETGRLDRTGRYRARVTRGAYTGTCLHTVNEDGEASYGERKGFPPLPLSHVEVTLRPGLDDPNERVQIATGALC